MCRASDGNAEKARGARNRALVVRKPPGDGVLGSEHPGTSCQHAARRHAFTAFHGQGGAKRGAETAGRRWFICVFV